MNIDDNNNSKVILNSVEFLLLAVTFLMMILALSGYTGVTSKPSEKSLKGLSTGWYYIENDKRVDIKLPTEVEVDGLLTIYNDTLDSESAGEVITMKGAQYNPVISVDGEELYRYMESDFERNTQMKSKLYCDAELPKDFRSGTVSMTFSDAEDGKYTIPEIKIGRSADIVRLHFIDEAVSMILIFVMFVVGIFALCVSVYFYFRHMGDRRFTDAGVFMFLCGIWCLTDSAPMQEACHMAPEVCLVSFYAFMLMGVPMVHFVQNTGNMKKYRIIDYIIYVLYMNAVVQGVLNYLKVFSFIQMLFVTHIVLALGVIILCSLLIREYRANGGRGLETILLAFFMLGISGVLAILLYWILVIPYYGVIYQFGILLFVILLLCSAIMTIVDNLRFRMEAEVYRRLAKEDRLTGLGNRRAFEEQLDSIEQNADKYNNVLLVFIDLNRLKIVNDRYGHGAGDELIIAASKCIERTFGEAGTCYRIGGDEFCAIVINPEKGVEEWFGLLEHEIDGYMRNSRHKLSLAKGYAYLRGKDGTIKTISDWKYEADYRMYENKGRRLRYDEL